VRVGVAWIRYYRRVRLDAPRARDTQERVLHLGDLEEKVIDEVPGVELLADHVRARHDLHRGHLGRAHDTRRGRRGLCNRLQKRRMNLGMKVGMPTVNDPPAEGRNTSAVIDGLLKRGRY
jgi:hypothetical protein